MGLAYVLFLSNSAFLAQQAGILAATLGAAAIIGFIRPAMSISIGGTAVFTVLYMSLLLGGHFLAEVPRSSAIFLLLAPLVSVLGLNDAARKSQWVQLVFAWVAVLILVCIAILLENGGSSSTGWDV